MLEALRKDLLVAAPSWIARMNDKIPKPYYASFVEKTKSLFDDLLDGAIEMWQASLKEPVPTSPGNLVNSLMKILESLVLNQFNKDSDEQTVNLIND